MGYVREVLTDCFTWKNWNSVYEENRVNLCAVGNTFHSDLQGFFRETMVCVLQSWKKPCVLSLGQDLFLCLIPPCILKGLYQKIFQQSRARWFYQTYFVLISYFWVKVFNIWASYWNKGERKTKQRSIVPNCGFYFYSKHTFSARKLDSWNQKQMERWGGHTHTHTHISVSSLAELLKIWIFYLCL